MKIRNTGWIALTGLMVFVAVGCSSGRDNNILDPKTQVEYSESLLPYEKSFGDLKPNIYVVDDTPYIFQNNNVINALNGPFIIHSICRISRKTINFIVFS